MSDQAVNQALDPEHLSKEERAAGSARTLFRYVTGEEWRDYRSIMAVFADTFFSEFSPDEVIARLGAAAVDIDPAVVPARLESLRGWGNLTVSSSVGNPANLADYYRRRNRYLITRAGQEVHSLVEGVLSRVDEVRDISTGRLRALDDALAHLAGIELDGVDPTVLSDAVRQVFDPHVAFTDEITQFFAAINQWQSRYDLTPDEFRFFAEVLVSYVAERLDEIERSSRPIERRLVTLAPLVPAITARVQGTLASRVSQAGLDQAVTVVHTVGTRVEDWEHLAAWFVGRPGVPSRITRLGRDALAAIRTLTLNLTRLSRAGVGAASRRADFLRLAQLFAANPGPSARLAAAAFGLYPASHLGFLADDTDDPVTPTTSWWVAPPAPVPVSIRERGDTTNRGRASPIRDQADEQRLVRWRREQQRRDRKQIDAELLAAADLDGAMISTAAMARLLDLLARSTHRARPGEAERRSIDGTICCVVQRDPAARTVVSCPEGTLTLHGVRVHIEPAPAVDLVADISVRSGVGVGVGVGVSGG